MPGTTITAVALRDPSQRYSLPSHDPAAQCQDAELVMLFTGGASMAEIARAIGLSRERVRQRLKRTGYTGKDHHGWKSAEPWITQHRRREAKDAAREARFQADAAKLRALAETLGRTPTLREAARELGASEKTWQGTGISVWLAMRAGRPQHRGGPYAPYTRRLYAAAGLTVRVAGGSHLGPLTPRTHCRRGHEFTPENTHTWKGVRRCRTCRRASRRPSAAGMALLQLKP